MKVLFIDRDGTLIVEPEDFQVDAIDKVALVDNVIPALLSLAASEEGVAAWDPVLGARFVWSVSDPARPPAT
ncbi:MAG: hypothetical protein AAGA33_11330, partial [Pseudomonadota bacterium]